jgi:hypothetical protein
MTHQRLTPEQARALFSDHLEGALDDETRRALEETLAASPELAAQHRHFAFTLRSLRELPRPAVPGDLLARVRAHLDPAHAPTPALARETPAASAAALASSALAPVVDVLPLHRALNDEVERARPGRRFGVEFFAAVASVAAVLAFVAIGVPVFSGRAFVRGDREAIVTAGLASAQTATVTWRVPGLPSDTLKDAAAAVDVTVDDEGRIAGTPAVVARFLVALKAAAAAQGLDVQGSVPAHADHVVVVVDVAPSAAASDRR